MTNYKLIIAYDGSKYNGFQKQTKHPEKTIQGKLEALLTKCFDEDIQLIASGRTDAGVHAKGQVCNFHTQKDLPIETVYTALKEYLPQDIAVIDLDFCSPRFHARYNALRKQYCYTLDLGTFADPFSLKFAYHVGTPLDIEAMREAASYLLGSHDFKSFTTQKSKTKSTVRHLHDITFQESGQKLSITYEGNGFLQHMVRILTGTLIEVGLGTRSASQIPDLIEACLRSEAGFTAPAHGLCMEQVTY